MALPGCSYSGIEVVQRVGDLIRYEKSHSSALEQYPDGIDYDELVKDAPCVFRNLGAKIEACARLSVEVGQLETLVDKIDAASARELKEFQELFGDCAKRVENYLAIRERCLFDLRAMDLLFADQSAAPKLRAKINEVARARLSHHSFPKRTFEGVCQELSAWENRLRWIHCESKRKDCPIKDSLRVLVEKDRAEFDELVALLHATVGKEEGVSVFVGERRALRSPVLPSSPVSPTSHTAIYAHNIKVWKVLQLCDTALRLQLSWEEIEGIGNLDPLLTQVKKELQESIRELDPDLRTEIYAQVYHCSPPPKGGRSWGEKNVVKNIGVLIRAIDRALTKHSEFFPECFRLEEEIESEPSAIETKKRSDNEKAIHILDELCRGLGDIDELKKDIDTKKAAAIAHFDKAMESLEDIDPLLAIRFEQRLDGDIFSLSTSDSKEGGGWAREHRYDDVSLLIFAIHTAGLPILLEFNDAKRVGL